MRTPEMPFALVTPKQNGKFTLSVRTENSSIQVEFSRKRLEDLKSHIEYLMQREDEESLEELEAKMGNYPLGTDFN